MNESDVLCEDAQLWKQLFRVALLETNTEIVPQRVFEARKAAGERAMQLIREAANDEELYDLIYASRVLDELKDRCQSDRHARSERPIPESQGWTTQEQAS